MRELRDRISFFKKCVLELGHGHTLMPDDITEDDIVEMVHEAEEILMEIDRYLGCSVEAADVF